MATLSRDQVQKLIVKPKNQAFIQQAAYQEERLVMHCEPILEKGNLPSMAFRDFTTWWQSLITQEKYNVISHLILTPLDTTSVTKDIFDQISKFIDAQDRYISYNFVTEDYTNDYEDYLKKINDDSFWRMRLIEALKTEINSYVVTDVPQVQLGERPEPYNYLVSVRSVVDVDINQFTGNVEYIIFRQSDRDVCNADVIGTRFSNLLNGDIGKSIQKLIQIDDKTYRILEHVDGKKILTSNEVLWDVTYEVEHNLGYCPVIDFWEPFIKGTSRINKKGPITNVLHKLNYLLFYKAMAKYIDLYGPFPAMAAYESEDEEFDQKNKETNYGVYQMDMFNPWDSINPTNNPRKSQRKNIGPGTAIAVPVPLDKNDHDMMDSPMKWITMPVESLQFVQDKIVALEAELVEICTGEVETDETKSGKNEDMINDSYSKTETIMNCCKRQFERVHQFVTKCRVDIRYGCAYFKGATIDYGSEYFLKNAGKLTLEFKEAMDAGMPMTYIAEIGKSAIQTRFKNNPDTLARMRIFTELEPYPNYTVDNLVDTGIFMSDKLNFIVKANFISFIKRFERENGDIVKFGSAISFSEKISIINKELQSYGSNTKWEPESLQLAAIGAVPPAGSKNQS